MQSTTSTRESPVIIHVDHLQNAPWYADSKIKISGTPLTVHELQEIKGNRLPDAATRRDEVIRLIYLTTLAEEGKSAFNEKELALFKESDTKATRVIVALWGGLSISLLLTFASLAGLTSGLDSLSNMEKAAIAVSVTVLCGVVINPMAYYATGFATNSSSNAYNDKQDISLRYAKTLSNSAKILLGLAYGNVEEQTLAHAIVQNIDMNVLRAKVEGALKNPIRSEDILDPLVQVVAFLKDDDIEHLKKETLRQFVLAKTQKDLEAESI
ncbi:hypothetical protein [Estrella lausannensis]|uniref:Putative membrane protein n=1 Tax=Estrella lausannensis TaxID=483423 RepID=A0A0H5DRN3_9BACT|nr:hypothetical protein [Estrella lausannensis]CRX39366.1 putative membrane protein [Estrella lausannensis]